MSIVRRNNPVMSAAKTVATYAAAKALKSAIDHPGKALGMVKNTWNAITKHKPRGREQVRVRGSGSSSNNASVAAAYSQFRRPYIAYRSAGNSLRVTGCEVIIPSVGNAGTNLNAVIPHNPAYWLGTRIQVLAKTYQMFHIERLIIHYIPRVPTSTAGSITIGTISTELPFGAVDSSVLANSLGGVVGPVWSSVSSMPDLRNTPLRYYQTYSPENSMDWAYVTAIAINGQTTPIGSIMFDYRITMVQPLWDGRTFYAQGLHTSTLTVYGIAAVETDPSYWRIANASVPTHANAADNILIVTGQGSSAATRPGVNCMSVLSATFDEIDTGETGYRKVYLTFGGHDLKYTGFTGGAGYLQFIMYCSVLDNSSTLIESTSSSMSTTTTQNPRIPQLQMPPPPFPSIQEANKQAWEQRSSEPPPLPPTEWARRSSSCGK